MSQEDIPNVLIRLTNVTGFDHTQEANLAFKEATEEIERLLAAEREKVRDWNARAYPKEHGPAYLETKEGSNKGHWVHNLIFGKRGFPGRCRADHIRQLDLTKLDDGGEEKG